MVLSYHYHMYSMIEDAEEIDWLMDGRDPALTLVYDTGHLHFAGTDPLSVLDKWSERIHHIHFKDVRQPVMDRIRAEDRSLLYAVAGGALTEPGAPEGCIDFQAVTDRRKAVNYAGRIVIEAERDPGIAPPFGYSTTSYERIISNRGRSGLQIVS
ncbi:TIM barrel protein [Tropicimonas aquimaris]|uniref:TIM barrel protein n=1 Tax=Tropicimonas aquimaris TaxID=914152 RepID=A0ABW3IVN4_9RHOB